MSRLVEVIFSASTSRLTAGLAGARRAAEQTAAGIKKSWSSAASIIRENSEELDRVGTGMMKAGALIGLGLGASAKAAMSWESAFAGVRKTVDELDPAFGALEGQLRHLARTMATSHEDIAAVAEEAGALGVATGDVAEFTRQMVILGETTNVTASEAATYMAQFMTIMGTAPDRVGNLAAALVDLGNNGASTEAQILEMSQRIAGAGRAVGMTEAQVMGFASAIASTGINVEAGGSAISRVFTKLDRIVTAGGSKLKTLSDLIGSDFATAFRQDASTAVTQLIQALGHLQDQGGSVTGVLDQIGIKQIYETDVIRRLAGAHALLADQVGLSGQAMDRGTANLDEYAKRAQTAEFKTATAWNNIKDAAIEAGNDMLPIIEDAAEQVVQLTQTFQDMPGPVRSASVSIAAVTAGALLLGGGVAKGTTMISKMITSMGTLGISAGKAKLALGGVGLALGAGAIAYGLWADAAARAERNAEDFAATLLVVDGKVTTTAATYDALNQKLVTTKTGMLGWGPTVADLMDDLGVSASRAQEYILGVNTSTERLLRSIGSGEGATDLIAGLTEIRESMSEAERQALQKAVADQTAGAETARHTDSLREQRRASQESADAMKELADSMFETGRAQLQLSGSKIGMESAIDDTTDAIKRVREQLIEKFKVDKDGNKRSKKEAEELADAYIASGKALDINTRSGQELNGMLDRQAIAGRAAIETLTAQKAPTEEIVAVTERVRKKFIENAEAMGYGSEEAAALADSYNLIPEQILVEILTTIDPSGMDAWNRWEPPTKWGVIKTKVLGEYRTGAGSIAEADGGLLVSAGRGRLMRAYADSGLFTTRHGHYTGPLMRAYADSGTTDTALPAIGSQQPRIEHNRGQRGIQWSETGAGPWEGFVSGHPQKRRRSRAVTEDIADRLGGDIVWRAAGGGMLTLGRPTGTPGGSLAATNPTTTSTTGTSMPTYKGKPLDYWEDKLLTPLELTRLKIRIRNVEKDLKATEKYGKGKKKKTRKKLRGLDRSEARLELAELKQDLADAQTAAAADKSKSGTLAKRIEKYETAKETAQERADQATKAVEDAWTAASSTVSGWAGFAGFDTNPTKHTNAGGDIWYTPTTGANYASQLKKHADDSNVFRGKLDALRRAGASEALVEAVQQEASRDIASGIAMADAFLTDRAALQSANSSYARLDATTAKATAGAVAARAVPVSAGVGGVLAAGSVRATIADGEMARALAGVRLTLMVEGKPISAIIQQENAKSAASLRNATGGW